VSTKFVPVGRANSSNSFRISDKIKPNPTVDVVNYGLLIFINCIFILYLYNTKNLQVVYWNSHNFSRCRFADLVGLLVQIRILLKGQSVKLFACCRS
jgi:hypothetical protein